VTEAMAMILKKETERYYGNVINLLFCRIRSQSNNSNHLFDDESDSSSDDDTDDEKDKNRKKKKRNPDGPLV
jgi:hypothetical protein